MVRSTVGLLLALSPSLASGCASSPYDSLAEELSVTSLVVEQAVERAGAEVEEHMVAQGPCNAARGTTAGVRTDIYVPGSDGGASFVQALESQGVVVRDFSAGESGTLEFDDGLAVVMLPFHDDPSRFRLSWAAHCYRE